MSVLVRPAILQTGANWTFVPANLCVLCAFVRNKFRAYFKLVWIRVFRHSTSFHSGFCSVRRTEAGMERSEMTVKFSTKRPHQIENRSKRPSFQVRSNRTAMHVKPTDIITFNTKNNVKNMSFRSANNFTWCRSTRN